MLDLIAAHFRAHFTFAGFFSISLAIFGTIIFGCLQLMDYLQSSEHLSFLVLPVAGFAALCAYWLLWFPAKATRYFLPGEHTFLQSLQLTCLDWWLFFRRLPLVRRLFRNPTGRSNRSEPRGR